MEPGRSTWSLRSLGRVSLSHLNAWDPASHISTAYEFSSIVDEDMSSPLSHYFISSGHNSYLISDQIVGPSGTGTIEKSLLGGCRLVELDVYNGNNEEGPICKHGGTATRPVPFRDCVIAIRQHAWAISSYPVIITIENHTDAHNQLQLVKILKDLLGSNLFIPPPGEHAEWLSPSTLAGKFLIRCKLKEAIDELKSIVYLVISKFQGFEAMSSLPHVTSSSVKEGKVEAFVKSIKAGAGPLGAGPLGPGGRFSFVRAFQQPSPSPAAGGPPFLQAPLSPLPTAVKPIRKVENQAQGNSSVEGCSEASAEQMTERNGASANGVVDDESVGLVLVPNNSQLLDHDPNPSNTPPKSTPPPLFPLQSIMTADEPAKANKAPITISQSSVLPSNLSRTSGGSSTSSYCTIQEVFNYSRRHVLRVYPAAWKVDSRNFDPCPSWSLGACVVALNWQKWDKAMWINQGRFKVNGNCGYIRKPQWMVEGDEGGLPCPPIRDHRVLRVHIYSACMKPPGSKIRLLLPCSSGASSHDSISFKVWLKGMPTDSGKRIIPSMDLGNGKLRIETTFDFKLCYPEMAVLLFIAQVENDGDEGGLSYFSLPLATLVVGRYKLGMLDGKSGRPIPSWIKVAMSWVEGVSEE